MLEFFQTIVRFLNENSIPYMLSGSVAMSIYVVPRTTKDIDFVVHLQPDDINKIVARFKKGYYVDEDAIKDAVKYEGMFNIIDHASQFKADFVVLKSSDYRQKEFGRRTQVEFLGMPVYIVSPEDLLPSKIIWIQELPSGRQMEDIQAYLH